MTHCISISSTLLSMYCAYHFVASGAFVDLWCSLIFYEDVFQCAALCFSGVLQDAAITAILLTWCLSFITPFIHNDFDAYLDIKLFCAYPKCALSKPKLLFLKYRLSVYLSLSAISITCSSHPQFLQEALSAAKLSCIYRC